jgi:hypothetical protein
MLNTKNNINGIKSGYNNKLLLKGAKTANQNKSNFENKNKKHLYI